MLLLLFHQHYRIFMYIILTKTYEILHYWHHNICMLIVTYFRAACFKEILVSAPWRWGDNNVEIYRCHVIMKVCKHYRVVHLLVFFVILTDYGTITPLIKNCILTINISRSIFKTQSLHNFHTSWNVNLHILPFGQVYLLTHYDLKLLPNMWALWQAKLVFHNFGALTFIKSSSPFLSFTIYWWLHQSKTILLQVCQDLRNSNTLIYNHSSKI